MKRNFKFVNNGSVIQIFALTKKATEWLNNNLCLESWQWFGNSICVEPRYANDIYEAIQNDFD